MSKCCSIQLETTCQFLLGWVCHCCTATSKFRIQDPEAVRSLMCAGVSMGVLRVGAPGHMAVQFENKVGC